MSDLKTFLNNLLVQNPAAVEQALGMEAGHSVQCVLLELRKALPREYTDGGYWEYICTVCDRGWDGDDEDHDHDCPVQPHVKPEGESQQSWDRQYRVPTREAVPDPAPFWTRLKESKP